MKLVMFEGYESGDTYAINPEMVVSVSLLYSSDPKERGTSHDAVVVGSIIVLTSGSELLTRNPFDVVIRKLGAVTSY